MDVFVEKKCLGELLSLGEFEELMLVSPSKRIVEDIIDKGELKMHERHQWNRERRII